MAPWNKTSFLQLGQAHTHTHRTEHEGWTLPLYKPQEPRRPKAQSTMLSTGQRFHEGDPPRVVAPRLEWSRSQRAINQATPRRFRLQTRVRAHLRHRVRRAGSRASITPRGQPRSPGAIHKSAHYSVRGRGSDPVGDSVIADAIGVRTRHGSCSKAQRRSPYEPESREASFVRESSDFFVGETNSGSDYWEWDPDSERLIRWHGFSRFGVFKPNVRSYPQGCP